MALVARTTGDVAATTRSLQQLVRELDPALPTFDARSMETTVSESLARLSFTMIMLGVAAAVTLALGVVGLYGVIAYIVTLRTRGLGVRIALGAARFGGDGRAPGTRAQRVGDRRRCRAARGGWTTRAVVPLRVAPMDPRSAPRPCSALFALLASWIPARRASMVDPPKRALDSERRRVGLPCALIPPSLAPPSMRFRRTLISSSSPRSSR
jgi:hypothetical protein